MNVNEMEQNSANELSVPDLWKILCAGWYYVLGGTLIGVLGAGLAIALLPTKYEAVAVVQVGQVGQVGQSGTAGQPFSAPVEPVMQAIERMKLPAFQMKVAKTAGITEWKDDLLRSAGTTTKFMTLQIVRGTATAAIPLIELKTSARTPELARKIAQASIDELAKRQLELAKPTIDRMRLDLLIAREKLASAEKEREGLYKLMANVGVKDDRFTQLSLMTGLRVQKESELFAQRQLIGALETALTVPYTQPAEVLEEIFVTDNPVSPRKTLLLALGLVSGLLLGVLWVFFNHAWRSAKRERAGHAVS
ncbi:MAG: Wzz/FepE/Etk N-terminal domain-containing protein [Candidatus Accumulibacter sp. UW26]|jgi:hypothetical protein